MSRFFDIFRQHPWWIAGAVLGVVVLIWLMSRGGSSTSTGIVGYGPSDATVQANAAIESARITANASTAQAQLNNELQSKLADVQASITANTNATAATINAQNTGAATTINGQNTGAAININTAAIASNERIQGAQVTLQHQLADWQHDIAINQQHTDVSLAQVNQQITAGQQANDLALGQMSISSGLQNSLAQTLINSTNKQRSLNYINPLTGGSMSMEVGKAAG